MKNYIEVYFKDLSHEIQSQIKKWKHTSSDFTENLLPVITLLPEDLEYFDEIYEWDDDFDGEMCHHYCEVCSKTHCDDREIYNDFDEDYDYDLSYCGDDCETCIKVGCEERDFHNHDLDW